MNLCEKVRAIREAEGLSRSGFSQETGIASRTLEGIEQGRREPGGELLSAIGKRWPQYARWLLTDETRPEHGDISPAQETARKDSARDGTHD